MTGYFLVAFLLGTMLRFVVTLIFTNHLHNCKSEEELMSGPAVYVLVISYFLGSVLKWGGLSLLIASVVASYIL